MKRARLGVRVKEETGDQKVIQSMSTFEGLKGRLEKMCEIMGSDSNHRKARRMVCWMVRVDGRR